MYRQLENLTQFQIRLGKERRMRSLHRPMIIKGGEKKGGGGRKVGQSPLEYSTPSRFCPSLPERAERKGEKGGGEEGEKELMRSLPKKKGERREKEKREKKEGGSCISPARVASSAPSPPFYQGRKEKEKGRPHLHPRNSTTSLPPRKKKKGGSPPHVHGAFMSLTNLREGRKRGGGGRGEAEAASCLRKLLSSQSRPYSQKGGKERKGKGEKGEKRAMADCTNFPQGGEKGRKGEKWSPLHQASWKPLSA